MTVTDDQQRVHPLGVPASAPEPTGTAREAVDQMPDAGLLDALMDRVEGGGLALTGEGGFLPGSLNATRSRGTPSEPRLG